MVSQEAIDAARAAAIMVRVHGPDPKGQKMRRHAFYHSVSGDTTLSASGLLLPNQSLSHTESGVCRAPGATSLVITCASIVEPFILNRSSSTKLLGAPKLIPGAEVDILVEKDGAFQNMDHSPHWIPAQLVALVDIPLAAAALQALLDAHGGSIDGPWEIGWSLAPAESTQLRGFNTQTFTMQQSSEVNEYLKSAKNLSMDELSDRGSLALATTRIAVLRFCSEKIIPFLAFSEQRRRGDFILAIGSPFGALSPLHFFNSISVGIVANCWPPTSSQVSLLMADVRCLPGMEGGPIFSECGSFVGMLARPLRQRGGGTEVQLVITWNALAPALHDVGVNLQQNIQQEGSLSATSTSNCVEMWEMNGMSDCREQLQFPAINNAVSSVVLVTVGDGAWASGIILNKKGLILTNAHLLEPWRFGKAQSSSAERGLSVLENQKDFDMQRLIDSDLNHLRFQLSSEHSFCRGKHQDFSQMEQLSKDEVFRLATECSVMAWPALETDYKSYRRIRVRLDHIQPHAWCDAKAIYVSQGPLDVALLLLDVVPFGLLPVIPEEGCPLPGSAALVIGHGIFGPRSDLGPSISAGVVSRVVKSVKDLYESETEMETPAMLETTAAVHPGGSGGAVVNAYGQMIGLVTSNARHSGGTIIPHLNFSIPCAALKPIFSFATGDMKDRTILSFIDKPNQQLSAVWALVPPTPPRSAPQFPFVPLPIVDKYQDGNQSKKSPAKGSRFAKFISDNGMQLSLKRPQSGQGVEGDAPRRWPLVKEMKNNAINSHIYHSRM